MGAGNRATDSLNLFQNDGTRDGREFLLRGSFNNNYAIPGGGGSTTMVKKEQDDQMDF